MSKCQRTGTLAAQCVTTFILIMTASQDVELQIRITTGHRGKRKKKSTEMRLTISTSFFSSSISFSFFFPFPFFLPPCSEVAASSYCSRPSWKTKSKHHTKCEKATFSMINLKFYLKQSCRFPRQVLLNVNSAAASNGPQM